MCSPPTLFPAQPRDREKLGSAITPMGPSEGRVNTSFQFIVARPPHVLGARVAMVVVAALRCAAQGTLLLHLNAGNAEEEALLVLAAVLVVEEQKHILCGSVARHFLRVEEKS